MSFSRSSISEISTMQILRMHSIGLLVSRGWVGVHRIMSRRVARSGFWVWVIRGGRIHIMFDVSLELGGSIGYVF